MRVSVEVQKQSLRQLREKMAEAAERGRDPRPVLRDIADDMRSSQRDFLRNPKWANQLSPEYAAQKARKGHGTQIGKLSGSMFNSLTNPADPNHYEDLTLDSIEVGSKNPNAIRFNQGAFRQTASGAANRQPKRKLWRLRVRDRKAMIARVTEYLLEPFE